MQKEAARFTYPTFYRYHMLIFLKEECSNDELEFFIYVWEQEPLSIELQMLAKLLNLYRECFPALQLIDIMQRIKAHMVSLHEFSFADHYRLAASHTGLLQLLETAGVAACFAAADALMAPGAFDPGAAPAKLGQAGLLAAIVVRFVKQYGAACLNVLYKASGLFRL